MVTERVTEAVSGPGVGQAREIARVLTERILDGGYPHGGRLPAESTLAEEFGVARGTVRRALGVVSGRGLVQPRSGSGWLVQNAQQGHRFDQLRSFGEWAEARGLRPGGLVLGQRWEPADAGESRRLRVPVAEPVLRVLRVRTLDGRTAMIERSSYAPWVGPRVERLHPEEPSVVAALEREAGIVTAHAEHTIDAIGAGSEDARLLGVRRSAALLRVRRTSFAPSGAAIECSEDRYLSGVTSFQVRTSRGPVR